MTFRVVALSLCLALATGCSTPNIGREMGVLSRSVDTVETSLAKSLAGRVAREHRQRVVEEARADATFRLSPQCAELTQANPTALASDCDFVTVVPKSAVIPNYEAEAVLRKVRGLARYVDTLALIANSDSQDEIVAAYDAWTKAAGSLAKAAESRQIATISRSADGQRVVTGRPSSPRVPEIRYPPGRVVGKVIARLRMRTLRQLTGEYDTDVQETVREARAILFSLGHDPRYRVLHDRMTETNRALQDATIAGDHDRIAKLALETEAAHDAFVDYAPQSDFEKLAAIARAHAALTARLARGAPQAQIVEFINSIKSLSKGLEGA